MSFVKLDRSHQGAADSSYAQQKHVELLIDSLKEVYGNSKWFELGLTNIEMGYMALRKGITEHYKSSDEYKSTLGE